MRSRVTVLAVAAAIALTSASELSWAGVVEGGPDPLAGSRSLRDVIADAKSNPVHIVFVHGIRASGPGTSLQLRQSLCAYVKDGCVAPSTFQQRDRVDMGDMAADATFEGGKIWTSSDEWAFSRPFVDHYVFRRKSGGPIVVDEVNWWPLLFALKCRALIETDASLVGPDSPDLATCSKDDRLLPDEANKAFYPWISAADVAAIKARPLRSGGAKRVNFTIKTQILDWGLSDAVITSGPMRYLIRRALGSALEQVAAFDPDSPRPLDWRTSYQTNGPASAEYVVVSESLGSFAILDTFNAAGFTETRSAGTQDEAKAVEAASAARFVVGRAYSLYFMANQFQILELARIEGIRGSDASGAGLRAWGGVRPPIPGKSGVPNEQYPKQIIAFDDPSDVLTWQVPRVDAPANQPGAPAPKVINLFVNNGFGWFGGMEWPVTAHTGYMTNPCVLGVMFNGKC